MILSLNSAGTERVANSKIMGVSLTSVGIESVANITGTGSVAKYYRYWECR
jgi:hypothetical protein